jgi:multidrug resistance protein
MAKKVLPILFLTLLLDMIGAGMIFPVIPIILTDASSPSFLLHGFSVSDQYIIAGLLTALFGIMQFFAAPILGELSDIFGRKKLLMLGVATLAVGQLFFGFAIVIASIPLLFFSRIIAGLAGANFSIAQASIADVTEPHDRAKNFGLIGAAFGLGFVLGPLLGGWIVHLSGLASAPFWLAGALGIVNVLVIYFMLPETKKTSAEVQHKFHLLKGITNIKQAFADKDARGFYGASFVMQLGFAFFTAFIGILLVSKFNFDAGGVGTFFGAVGAWVVVTQLVVLRVLTKKFNERAILRYSLLILAVGLAIYPFLPNDAFLYIAMPLVAIGNGLSVANLTALISKGVSAEKQGAALGINGSLMALAQGTAPVVAGIGSGVLGIASPFVVAGALVVLSWWMLFTADVVRAK